MPKSAPASTGSIWGILSRIELRNVDSILGKAVPRFQAQERPDRKGKIMLDVVDVLETIGENAKIKGASNAELELVLDRLNVDPAMVSAVLNGDQGRLEKVLGASSNVCCVQRPSDDEESDEQPDEVPADDTPERQ